jgi:hypothetical protein
MTSMRRWIRRTSPRSFSLSDSWPRRKLKKLIKVKPQGPIKVILIQMRKQQQQKKRKPRKKKRERIREVKLVLMTLRKIKKRHKKPRRKLVQIKNKMKMLYKSNSRRILKESARRIPENIKKAKIRKTYSLQAPKNKLI